MIHVGQEPRTLYEDHLRASRMRFLPEDLRVILDVGCGSGRVPYGDRIVDGVEPDSQLRDEAKRTGKFRRLMLTIPDVVSNYDCVILLGVLEHLNDPGQMLDTLADARHIYITVPNANSIHRMVGVKAGLIDETTDLQEHDLEIGHCRYYDLDAIRALIDAFSARHSFKVEEIGSTCLKFMPSGEQSFDLAGAYDAVGYDIGLCGKFRMHGAELYALLRRK